MHGPDDVTPFSERGVRLSKSGHQRRTALLDRFVSTPAPNDIKPVEKHKPASMDRTSGLPTRCGGRLVPTSLNEDMPLGGTTPSSCRGNYLALATSARGSAEIDRRGRKRLAETSQGRTQEVMMKRSKTFALLRPGQQEPHIIKPGYLDSLSRPLGRFF